MRIGCVSFIVPAGRIENLGYLQGKVDEVELLFMCSDERYDWVDAEEIAEIASFGMRYNIHMPYDRDLKIESEWDVMIEFAEILKPINAVTHTFHIEDNPVFFDGLDNFIKETGLPVTLENAGADVEVLEQIKNPNIGICLDVGHMVHYGQDVFKALEVLGDRIELFHLHGVKDGKDHQSIRYLDKEIIKAVVDFATVNALTISLEVFNEKDLIDSLGVLKEFIS